MVTPLPRPFDPLHGSVAMRRPSSQAGVFVGLLLQPLAAALKPLLVPAILLPFIVALLRLDAARLRADLRRPG